MRDVGGIHDAPRTLLVTTQASLDALGEELDGPIDLRRFRPNVHLETDAAAWEDLGWEGAELAFSGGVRLRLLHPCERCAIPTRHPETQIKWPGLLRHLAAAHDQQFGINARVLTGGRLGLRREGRAYAGFRFPPGRSIRDEPRPEWRTRCFVSTRPPGRWSPPKPRPRHGEQP